MFCQHCGADVDEGGRFCSKCGREFAQSTPSGVPEHGGPGVSIEQPRPRQSRLVLKFAVLSVVLVVLLLIILAILDGLGSSVSDLNPIAPTYSATVTVSVRNDAWLSSEMMSIYIDGDLRKTASIGPMDTESWSFGVSWKSTTTHECRIVVTSGGDSDSKTIYISDGDSRSVSFTI